MDGVWDVFVHVECIVVVLFCWCVLDFLCVVVRAGIKQFPYPNLQYECGMGKCAKCATRVIAGAEHLPPPNWKEKKQLGERLNEGYRLACQLWLEHDIELAQD